MGVCFSSDQVCEPQPVADVTPSSSQRWTAPEEASPELLNMTLGQCGVDTARMSHNIGMEKALELLEPDEK
jgi:hypothetical protein